MERALGLGAIDMAHGMAPDLRHRTGTSADAPHQGSAIFFDPTISTTALVR